MKRTIFWLALLTPLAAATTPLRTGAKYDFIARDGQHVYAAEFVSETETAYVVKTDGFRELVSIEKSILSGPPRPSADKPAKNTYEGRLRRLWNLSVAGDLRMASGAFANYAQFFPGASLRLSRKVGPIPYTGINALALFVQYAPIARSPRRIDMFNFAIGPKWRKRFRKYPQVEFHLQAAPALSVIRYQSFTFDAWSTNIGAVAAAGADWSIGSNLAITAALGTHYVYDQATFVLMHTFSVGVGYAW